MPPEWIQTLGILVNFSLLIVGVKLTRQFARIELKVETMWTVFVRRFGSRGSDSRSSDISDGGEVGD